MGVLLLAAAQAEAQGEPAAAPNDAEVPLSEVLAYAERHALRARLADARRGYADAAREAAALRLRDDPTFSFGIGPRFDGASDRDFDFQTSLSQTIDVSGGRRLRVASAARLTERLDAEAAAARWVLREDVVAAYQSAVVARNRARVAERIVGFATEMLAIAERRLAAGDGTAIEVRLAEADLALARQASIDAARAAIVARLVLCEVSGWPPDSPPQVTMRIDTPGSLPELEAAIRVAEANDPRLTARRAAVEAARAAIAVADRSVAPSPTIGAQFSREGSAGSPANYILLGTIAMPLPLWQRNREERARARVDLEVALVEEEAESRALRVRVTTAHAQLVAASERVALFDRSASASLEANLALLERAARAGEIPIMVVAAGRERFSRVELDSLDAVADYHRARAALEGAIGVDLGAMPEAVGAP